MMLHQAQHTTNELFRPPQTSEQLVSSLLNVIFNDEKAFF